MQLMLDNALTFFALLAVGLMLCLYLFATLKREIQMGRKRQATLEAALRRVSAGMGEVTAKLAETEERAAMLVAPMAPRPGLNLSTRSHALRMWRRGDEPQQIAGALGIPEREVELLLKVQRMVMEAAAGPREESGPAMNTPTGWEMPQKDSPRAPLEAADSVPVRA
jgi:hypothetical protein